MSVTSWQFAALLGATLALLRFAPEASRKCVLIGASLLFYANASLVSLVVILGLIGGNFIALQAILRTEDEVARDRVYLGSIIGNLMVFIALKLTFEPAAGLTPRSLDLLGLPVSYPLGLSFIILMLHSALTDAHSGKYVPKGRLSTFVLFGTFFPYVTAGPVERLERMERALDRPVRPTLDDLREGLVLIGMGLVKKLVVAGRLKPYVDEVFSGDAVYSSPTMAFAIALNVIYIYADFSGYTDIARGCARCLGIQVSINFDKPLGSRSITEFWRRWHISFSTWLRDYIYMPVAFTLGRWGKGGVMAALLVTFIICGFWHRATWNFVLFGVLHGLALAGEMKLARPTSGGRLREAAARLYMFSFLAATLVLFSTASLSDAGQVFARLYTSSPIPHAAEAFAYRGIILFSLMFVGLGIWQVLDRWRARLTAATTPFFFAAVALIILFLGQPDGQGFVYAQF